jgi:uracil-DNA glycosylase
MDPRWKEILQPEFEQEYFTSLQAYLKRERELATVLPPSDDVFTAFTVTPFDKIRVVILGQDPYHGPGQAHGLAFSVRHGVKIPASLANIFKEAEADVGIPKPSSGYLLPWAEQGVLLLNRVLTVQEGLPGCYRGQGWERFTNAVFRAILGLRTEHMVFILWGRDARDMRPLIDDERHTILLAPHPSPMSAHSGFFGSKPFSKTNEALIRHGQEPIDWRLP